MPSHTAQRLCPQAIFLPARFEVYRAVSQQIMTIFCQQTTLVEPLRLDEAYLDVSDTAHHLDEATRLAREIKRQIWDQTRLTASAGVSYCKFLAKIASDAHKPDGLTVISREEAPAFLEALPIEKFFGVGKVTAAKLGELGIQTGADLKHIGEERLRDLFGKHGGQLYRYACGVDDRPVEPVRERKSVGKEVTLERDIRDRSEMERILETLALQVERRLAELGIAGRTLTLKVRWSTFELVTRAASRVQGFQSSGKVCRISSGLQRAKHSVMHCQVRSRACTISAGVRAGAPGTSQLAYAFTSAPQSSPRNSVNQPARQPMMCRAFSPMERR